MSMYREGFSHISTMVDGLHFFSKESFGILADSYRETNNQQLEQIRRERRRLEIEIKYFLARANAKMMYFAQMEEHMKALQRQFDGICDEAIKEMNQEGEGSEHHEEQTQTDADREGNQETTH